MLEWLECGLLANSCRQTRHQNEDDVVVGPPFGPLFHKHIPGPITFFPAVAVLLLCAFPTANMKPTLVNIDTYHVSVTFHVTSIWTASLNVLCILPCSRQRLAHAVYTYTYNRTAFAYTHAHCDSLLRSPDADCSVRRAEIGKGGCDQGFRVAVSCVLHCIRVHCVWCERERLRLTAHDVFPQALQGQDLRTEVHVQAGITRRSSISRLACVFPRST